MVLQFSEILIWGSGICISIRILADIAETGTLFHLLKNSRLKNGQKDSVDIFLRKISKWPTGT